MCLEHCTSKEDKMRKNLKDLMVASVEGGDTGTITTEMESELDNYISELLSEIKNYALKFKKKRNLSVITLRRFVLPWDFGCSHREHTIGCAKIKSTSIHLRER